MLRSLFAWMSICFALLTSTALAQVVQIVNTREVSTVFTVTVPGIGGATTYNCEVDATATAPPYVDSEHGDIYNLSAALNVKSSVASVTGTQVQGQGVIIFGQNGTIGSTSSPFNGGVISITSPDYWFTGTYNVGVDD